MRGASRICHTDMINMLLYADSKYDKLNHTAIVKELCAILDLTNKVKTLLISSN